MEVGKFYRNRAGEKVVCIYKNQLFETRPFKLYVVGRYAEYYNVAENGESESKERDIVDYCKEENE